MGTNMTKVTKSQIQDNTAEKLKDRQEAAADRLLLSQCQDAMLLLQEQQASNESDICDGQKKAAFSLRKSQQEGARALRENQQESAQELKNTYARFAQDVKEKNQTIHCLLSSYSLQQDDD